MTIAKRLTLIALFAGAPAFAQKSDDRILIYVDDVVPADKSLAGDSIALTTSLCAAIGADQRFDVLCAPDVKQILAFAATAAMVGTTGNASNMVQDRLDRTKYVVSTSFTKGGGAYVLAVKAGPKAADAHATTLYSDKPTVALEEKGDGQRKILEKLPALAARIAAALLTPTAPPPPPTPVPLPKASTGGW
jgi:hypothetical protein